MLPHSKAFPLPLRILQGTQPNLLIAFLKSARPVLRPVVQRLYIGFRPIGNALREAAAVREYTPRYLRKLALPDLYLGAEVRHIRIGFVNGVDLLRQVRTIIVDPLVALGEATRPGMGLVAEVRNIRIGIVLCGDLRRPPIPVLHDLPIRPLEHAGSPI